MASGIIFKIIGIYDALLILLGTLGNAFVFYVAFRNRKNTTFLFLMFLSVSDSISLYWWNLNHFFTSFQLSGWMLVLISADRFLSVLLISWKTVYFKPKRALIAAIITAFSIIAINFHVLITFGYVRYENGTRYDDCFSTPTIPSTKIMADWQIVHSTLYSYAPFTLLALFNALLIILLQMKRRRSQENSSSETNKANKQKSLNITVITLTTLFIVMTLFGTLASIHYDILLESETGLMMSE